MQVPFPALTHLRLRYDREPEPVIPDTFLGGSSQSAPRLQYLRMEGIPFPGIPNLLLSVTHLVDLYLHQIPHSGYISPEAMANCLSVLINLDTLSLGFLSPQSRPNMESQHPPPITWHILPGLTTIYFTGASEYLDDLVGRIDAPRLEYLSITFFFQLNFDTPHLAQFISRTPRLQEPNEIDVVMDVITEVVLYCTPGDRRVEILCEEPRGQHQLSFVTQVCTMCLPTLPTAESLRLRDFFDEPYLDMSWKDDVENDQWLELLRPFTAVRNLYISEEFQPNIASALQELVGGRTTEVLPSLQKIFMIPFDSSRSFKEAFGQFVAARRVSGYPIDVLPS